VRSPPIELLQESRDVRGIIAVELDLLLKRRLGDGWDLGTCDSNESSTNGPMKPAVTDQQRGDILHRSHHELSIGRFQTSEELAPLHTK